jgi:hypothetical protein
MDPDGPKHADPADPEPYPAFYTDQERCYFKLKTHLISQQNIISQTITKIGTIDTCNYGTLPYSFDAVFSDIDRYGGYCLIF